MICSSLKFGSISSAVAAKTSEWSDMSLFSQDGHNLAPVLPPLHKQQRLIFYLYKCLSSDTYCQHLARMSHQFPNQMLPHQSNLHSLSPVISFRFKGCNLKHEWRRFPDVCFSSLVIKIIYFQVFEYIMLKMFVTHIHFLFTTFFPLSTWYDAIIFKEAQFSPDTEDACASRTHYARTGKHLFTWGTSTQQLDPPAECTVLF